MSKFLLLALFFFIIFPTMSFGQQLDRGVVVGYYQTFRWSNNPLTNEYIDRLSHVIIFHLYPTSNGGLDSTWLLLRGQNLTNAVTNIRNRGRVPMITIGGGGGATAAFNPALTNATNRANLVRNLLAFVDRHGFQGICLDWEFPRGDAEWIAYMDFLIAIKDARPNLRVTVAVGGDSPNPQFGNHFNMGAAGRARVQRDIWRADAIHLMTYDMMGVTRPVTWRTHACPVGSEATLNAWVTFGQGQPGFDRRKLLIGIAFYDNQGTPGDTPDEARRKVNFAHNNNFGGVLIWETFPSTHNNNMLNAVWNQNTANGGWVRGGGGTVTNRTITVTHNGNGTVRNGTTTINNNGTVTVANSGNVTLTITPNSGFQINEVRINNTVNEAARTSGSHTFSNVTSNQTINVTFGAIPQTRHNVPGNIPACQFSALSAGRCEGNNIGYLENNTFVEYLLNVGGAGDYRINIQAAEGSNQARTVTVRNGNTVLGTINVPGGSSWTAYSARGADITLPNGNMTLRLTVNGAVNIQSVEIARRTPIDSDPNPTGRYIQIIGAEDASWSSYVENTSPATRSRVEFNATANDLTATLARGTPNVETEQWVWLGLGMWNFADRTPLRHVRITYTANRGLRFAVGATENYVELAQGNNITRTFALSSFAGSPSATVLGNSNSGIIFFHEEDGQSVTLTVTSLQLYGPEWLEPGPTLVAGNRNRTVSGISAQVLNGNINLSLPLNVNTAEIALFDIRGRQLFERNIAVGGAGTANIALPSTVAKNQTVILQVKTNSGQNLTKRVLVK